MTEKEFEEKQLHQLLIDLKDIDNYKKFINGSFIYNLGYYQGLLLVNEITRLNNIINELEVYCNIVIGMNFNMNNSALQEQKVEDYTDMLDKIKELRGNSNVEDKR